MRLKRPYIASLEQVRISREDDTAVIEYVEPGFWTTHFKLGPEVREMTDQEILDTFNDHLVTSARLREEYEHIASEIPPGKPQIGYSARSDQWVPRGFVLRGVIDNGGPNNEPIIHIDDRELSWTEFGRALTTFAGWGMRVIFVPDDEISLQPRIEVREPENGRR